MRTFYSIPKGLDEVKIEGLNPPSGGSAVSPPPCRHKFIFLRREWEAPQQRGTCDVNTSGTYYDVFFCEHCLEYRRVWA